MNVSDKTELLCRTKSMNDKPIIDLLHAARGLVTGGMRPPS